jgi:hypothetical protein
VVAGITEWGLKVQTIDEPRCSEEDKATGKEEEGIKEETICRAHHEIEIKIN